MKNIVGIYGIDTRALAILRSNGSMNGIITSEDKSLECCTKLISQAPKMEGLNLSKLLPRSKNISGKTLQKQILTLEKGILISLKVSGGN